MKKIIIFLAILATLIPFIIMFLPRFYLVRSDPTVGIKPTVQTFKSKNYSNECLHLSLKSPTSKTPRQVINYILKVKNICDKPTNIEVRLLSPKHDLLVTTLSGEVVWQYTAGTVSPALLKTQTTQSLDTGKELSFNILWHGRDWQGKVLPPDVYQIIGLFYPDKKPIEIVKQLKVVN